MTQYIDKDALLAEIEKFKADALQKKWQCKRRGLEKIMYQVSAYNRILSYIGILEVKEDNFIWNNAKTTVPEDSINQIICLKEDGLAVSTVGKIVNGTIKWAYLDDLLNTNSFNTKVKEVDLEEEYKEFVDEDPVYSKLVNGIVGKSIAKHFFELGLKAQKGE